MIPIAALMPYKWLAIAIAFAATAAWGGLGWWGKAAAERDFAEYQRQAADVIVARLIENAALAEAQARRSAEISTAFQEGQRAIRKSLEPQLDELDTLRALWNSRGRNPLPESGGLRHPAPDPGTVPSPADPPGGPHAVACTDQPGAIIESAHRVAQDLEACALDLARLSGLQRWVREVCQAER